MSIIYQRYITFICLFLPWTHKYFVLRCLSSTKRGWSTDGWQKLFLHTIDKLLYGSHKFIQRPNNWLVNIVICTFGTFRNRPASGGGIVCSSTLWNPVQREKLAQKTMIEVDLPRPVCTKPDEMYFFYQRYFKIIRPEIYIYYLSNYSFKSSMHNKLFGGRVWKMVVLVVVV